MSRFQRINSTSNTLSRPSMLARNYYQSPPNAQSLKPFFMLQAAALPPPPVPQLVRISGLELFGMHLLDLSVRQAIAGAGVNFVERLPLQNAIANEGWGAWGTRTEARESRIRYLLDGTFEMSRSHYTSLALSLGRGRWRAVAMVRFNVEVHTLILMGVSPRSSCGSGKPITVCQVGRAVYVRCSKFMKREKGTKATTEECDDCRMDCRAINSSKSASYAESR